MTRTKELLTGAFLMAITFLCLAAINVTPGGGIASGGGGSPGGSATQVQFNDGGSFGGNAQLTFEKSTGTLRASNLVANTFYINDLITTNPVNVVSGGTGRTNLTVGNLFAGNGTNGFDEVTLGTGLSLAGSAGSTRTLNSSGGGNVAFNETNIVVSTTNNVIWDCANFDRATFKLLTNLTLLIISNQAAMTKPAYALLQQDTNGTRTVTAFTVSGGLLVTNSETLIPTTNANRMSILSVQPAMFSTNVAVENWRTNLNSVPFTNSLASGGGGGGGDTAYITSVDSLDGSFTAAFTNGIAITVGASPITVTSLGRYIMTGDTGQSLRVKLCDSSCNVLVSANIDSSGSAGTFKYATVSDTVLSASTQYFLMVEFDGGGDHWPNNGTTITPTAVATHTAAENGSGTPCRAASGECYAPVNFKYH